MKTFTDTLEQLKAAGSPLEESNEVIMFLYSVDSSPFRPKIMELLGRAPPPDMETCIQELDDQRLLREVMKANNTLVRGSRDRSSEARKSHHDTIVNCIEGKPSTTKSDSNSTPSPKDSTSNTKHTRTPICYNCDKSGHRAPDCPMANVTCPICQRPAVMWRNIMPLSPSSRQNLQQNVCLKTRRRSTK